MASVLNRKTLVYLPSVNTADYPVIDWIINPDMSSVIDKPQKYWLVTGDIVSIAPGFTRYSYSINTDTKNGSVAQDKLNNQISSAYFGTQFSDTFITGMRLDVWTKRTLTIDEQSDLTTVINNHDGIPVPAGPQDINIKASAIVLPSIPKGFPDYTGYPRLIKGVRGEMLPGQRSFVYISFNYRVVIQGGSTWTDVTAEWGDYIDVEMTYGVGGPVVGQFLSTVYMHPGHETKWSTSAEDAQPIPPGICLRLAYTSVGSVLVRMTGEYLLRRTP